jgi:hypothetical protein
LSTTERTEQVIDFDTAEKIVKSLVFMPGWNFTIERGADAWWIGVNFPARNSNREYAPDGYRMPLIYGGTRIWPIEFAECCDETAFVDAVMMGVVNTWLHELCEFFRRSDSGYDAPYHPHRPEGVAAWARLVEHAGPRLAANFPDQF